MRHVFSEELRAPAWFANDRVIAAILYRDESTWLSPSESGTFSLATEPTRTTKIERAGDAPTPWDATTVVVHFLVSASDAAFRPGDIGWVRIASKPREALAIPNAAVLHEEEGSFVLIPSSDHRTFTRKRVELGRVVNGLARVVSGLGDHERIAIGDVFFSMPSTGCVHQARRRAARRDDFGHRHFLHAPVLGRARPRSALFVGRAFRSRAAGK